MKQAILLSMYLVTAVHASGLGTWSATESRVQTACPASEVCVYMPGGKLLSVGERNAQLYDSGKASWTPAGRMLQARTGPTATLLNDGRVLLAGGGTRSLEVFDPRTGSWSAVAGELSDVRSEHAAALLRNGSVLISGGCNGIATLSSTDLYDPVSGKVTPSGFLSVPRLGHTATTLADGKVLIAGGIGLASAEIYDPELQAFSPTGSLTEPRSGHLAILLPDNNEVLLTGGRGADGGALASAEVFDPSIGTFVAAAPMSKARAPAFGHATTRGAVLVSGGDGGAETFHFPTVRAVWSEKHDGSVEIDARGWQPGETIRLSVGDKAVGATADAQGKFTLEISVGSHSAGVPVFLSAHDGAWQPKIRIKLVSNTSLSVTTCENYGTAVYSTATVTGFGEIIPDGTVEFLDGSNTLASEFASDGEYILISAPAVGAHSLTAEYEGNDEYFSSTSGTVTCNISKAPTDVILSSSANPTVFGQPLQFLGSLQTFVANSIGLPPSGQVQFASPTAVLQNAPLQNGVATSVPPVPLAAGSYFVYANYLGDTNYSASNNSSLFIQTVKQAETFPSTSVTPSAPVYSQVVSVQFTVSAISPSQAIPQGSCTLTLDGVSTQCGTLDANGTYTATLGSSAYLLVGNHTLNYSFPTNTNFLGSAVNFLLTVNRDSPSVVASSSANPSIAGSSLTFTAAVTTTNRGIASGTVTFKDGATTLGTGTLNGSGITTFSTSSLGLGSHTINVAYGGDGHFNTASGSLTQSVTMRSQCDVNLDGVTDIADLQRVVNETMGIFQFADDLNQDGKINATDIQIEINAVLGLGCQS